MLLTPNPNKDIIMFLKTCNIDKTDRINRAVIGFALVIAALIGMSKLFFIILGLVLIIEGMIGWCSIPYLISKMKRS
jgi:disulfide bond formation protein DsbB